MIASSCSGALPNLAEERQPAGCLRGLRRVRRRRALWIRRDTAAEKGGVGAHDSRTAGAAPCVEFQEDKRRDLVAARGLSLVYGFHSSASTLGRIAMSALDSPDTWAVRITDTLFDELTERRVAGFQIFRFSSPRPPPRAGGRREPRVGRRLRRLHLAQKRPVARVIADALELEARLRSALPTGDNGYHPGAEGFAY